MASRMSTSYEENWEKYSLGIGADGLMDQGGAMEPGPDRDAEVRVQDGPRVLGIQCLQVNGHESHVV